jgi:hypothetical protein
MKIYTEATCYRAKVDDPKWDRTVDCDFYCEEWSACSSSHLFHSTCHYIALYAAEKRSTRFVCAQSSVIEWYIWERILHSFFLAFSVRTRTGREPDVTNAFDHVQFSVQQICWTEREVQFRVRRFCSWTERNRTFPTLRVRKEHDSHCTSMSNVSRNSANPWFSNSFKEPVICISWPVPAPMVTHGSWANTRH